MRGEVFARQLKLLALLEFRPEGIAPDEAAEELGMRRRTVSRDYRVIEDAGSFLRSLRPRREDRRGRLLRAGRPSIRTLVTAAPCP